jgi:hypothetical protein
MSDLDRHNRELDRDTPTVIAITSTLPLLGAALMRAVPKPASTA